MTGVDVKHPLRIAALDASIGRIADTRLSLVDTAGIVLNLPASGEFTPRVAPPCADLRAEPDKGLCARPI